MQLPPAQMANRDGDAGMETMLWDINIIPNELDNGYLMLPPGVLHMSALGRFGRFTLFSPRVSHSKHLPVFCFVLCFGFGGVCCFVVFLFPVLQVFGTPNSPRSLDLDDRQGFIASSAMQPKKKRSLHDSNLDSEDRQPDHSPEYGPVPGVEQYEVVQVAGGKTTAEFHWKCEALQSSAKRARLYGDKLPSEDSALSGIFGRADIFAGTIVSGYKHALAPTSIGAFEIFQSEAIPSRQTDLSSSSSSPPVSSIVLIGARREASDEDIRRMALSKFRDLILGDPAATNLGISLRSMLETGSVSHLIEQSFADCFRAKASTTLQKRTNSLWRLSKLFAANGMLTPLRFSEEDLYLALCPLRESKAGATSGQHIVEALHLLDSTAGFALVDIRVAISGRCRGVARDMFLGKDPLQQKHPLKIEHVAWLEELIHYSSPMRCCVIGQILFCIHAACRWRDSQRLRKIYIESSQNESLLHADATM